MARKLAWSVLYGVLASLAALAAKRAAAGIWRVATGEQPPIKKR